MWWIFSLICQRRNVVARDINAFHTVDYSKKKKKEHTEWGNLNFGANSAGALPPPPDHLSTFQK